MVKTLKFRKAGIKNEGHHEYVFKNLPVLSPVLYEVKTHIVGNLYKALKKESHKM